MNAPLRIELPPRHRTLFLSDIHLGSRNCHARELAAFLTQVRVDRLYLVGDIFDLWWMAERRAVWQHAHTAVLERLHALRRDGAEIYYIPGNHDRPIRKFVGLALPRMAIRRRMVHETADGRRLLVTHGDEHDAVTQLGGLHDWLGDKLYEAILTGNRLANRARRALGKRYWSLADFVKRQSGAAERYIERFVQASLADACRRSLDGVVCGHIHRPALIERDGIVYANDGDWVESLSAIAEAQDGTLSQLRWTGGHVEVVRQIAPRACATPSTAIEPQREAA